MRRTKVIFLDIDGVLNSEKTSNPRDLPYVIDKRLLRVFKRIVARTHAKIVLISDWRHDPAGLFSCRHWGLRYDDVVPDRPKKSRGDQIRAFTFPPFSRGVSHRPGQPPSDRYQNKHRRRAYFVST